MGVMRLILFGAFTICLRHIEHSTSFRVEHPHPWSTINIQPLYSIWSLNIPIGLGSVALAGAHADNVAASQGQVLQLIFLVLLVLIGSLVRGLRSGHEPLELRWSDDDWRNGVMIPNMFAGAAFLGSLYVIAAW